MKKIREHAAGIDIGARQIFVCAEEGEVRAFDTFTADLRAARDFLLARGITTVAMEATGSYWLTTYEVLEAAGLDVWLVDGRQTRQLPGRKTDVRDCQWIRELHVYGLLNRCFVPDGATAQLRSYKRLREGHIEAAAMHVNHMQKALTEMNVRLGEVLSQLHGASGLAVIDAILAGERDPEALLGLCHGSIRERKADQVRRALEGNYPRGRHLRPAPGPRGLRLLPGPDRRLRRAPRRSPREDHRRRRGRGRQKKKSPASRGVSPFATTAPAVEDLGGLLVELFDGRDATVLPGITDYSWLQIASETGTDLSRWGTEKQFTSWLGLAPGQHNSGKKRQHRGRGGGKPRAGQVFRQLAQSLIESKTPALGVFGRRIKSRRGPGPAVKATARKLAVLYWRLMVKGLDYVERGIEDYERRVAEGRRLWLEKSARQMGMQLVDLQPATELRHQ